MSEKHRAIPTNAQKYPVTFVVMFTIKAFSFFDFDVA